ncbi:MAG: nicotinate phosphoribosyltransferase [Treponema sp.]|jgi:nicotinate phosphoribosyltransferase|nr:nicotinate phosphoribosyltransferase [Treponema sp.]
MNNGDSCSALFTDFYSLTMAQGYWKTGMKGLSVFEMFFRKHPFGGGFSIFAGLGTLLERLTRLSFSDEDISYLKSLNLFEDGFLEHLRNFRFTGSLWALDEGTVIFPNEPLIRIEGNILECQIIEGMLLNTINFQSLIATKTARVALASGKGALMEFGLRRAQGSDGALSASRAAYIGGAQGTSNVLAGKTFGIPVMGTMAHAWIMAFPDEETAFQTYADIYPENSIFLIDTYDTLKSGILNAIKAGKKLALKGKNFGVRLDSGDIHYLSVEVRKILDREGLVKASISVSNDLDEYIVQTLTNAGAPIDVWGVGTQMITGGNEAAFTGVYKLAARDSGKGRLEAVMKFSDHPEKTTNPGIKQVWRIRDGQGMFVADVLALDDEEVAEIIEEGKTYTFWHPSADYRNFSHTVTGSARPLLQKRLVDGNLIDGTSCPLAEVKKTVQEELESLDNSYKRLLNPHIYKVSITEALRDIKLDLIKTHKRNF